MRTIISCFVGFYSGKVNASTISYAHVGAQATSPSLLISTKKTGGVIIGNSSSFTNNLVSVKIADYPNVGVSPYLAWSFGNQSNFRNCAFSATMPITGFVEGNHINGLRILGCSFTNNPSLPQPRTALGVYGTDFGVTIDQLFPFNGTGNAVPPIPSSFSGLDYAVRLKTVNGTTSATVRNSTFNNNTIAVMTDGVPAPNISYNSFTLPSGTVAANALGVVVNTGSGYHVAHNSFSAANGSVYGTGVNIINTGSDINQVHSNDYQGLWCGNLSNFLNRSSISFLQTGLQFLCNTDKDNTHDIAARGHFNLGGSIEGMAPNQGSAANAAGNTFSPSALYNIYNYTSEVQAVNYYYALGQMPNTVYGTTPILTLNLGNCDYPFDNNGSTGGGPAIGNGGPIGPLSRARVTYYMSDSTGMAHADSLDQALSDWGSPYAELTKADLLMEQGDANQANTVYNAIVSTHSLSGTEADEFTLWGRRLLDIRISQLQDSLSRYELDSAQVENLEGIADSAHLWAKVRARNWLSAFDGRSFATEMLFPGDTTQASQQRMLPANAEEVYVLAPNPVKGTLQLDYHKMTEQTEIFTISDVSGRVLLTTELKGLSGTKAISLSDLSAGVYFYKISLGKELKQTGKFVKQ
ncbi:MAG: T9SS type A sorting domain-containing protein [Bacteroidetes bacterium]|nr:T9SS type A sorting domain-containing protein [Bacteroidota bacterium]